MLKTTGSHDGPAGFFTPGLIHQDAYEDEEEEDGDSDDAGEPLRQQTLILSLSCKTNRQSLRVCCFTDIIYLLKKINLKVSFLSSRLMITVRTVS